MNRIKLEIRLFFGAFIGSLGICIGTILNNQVIWGIGICVTISFILPLLYILIKSSDGSDWS